MHGIIDWIEVSAKDVIMNGNANRPLRIFSLFLILLTGIAYTQPASVRGVFANGSGVAISGTTHLKGTFGQALVGLTENATGEIRGGFWYTIHREVVAIPSLEIPVEFRLKQNYPNPFVFATTIPFSLPEEAEIEIGVYDLNGRLVTDIPREKLAPGHHELVLRSDGMSPGTYFCRLVAGEYKATTTLILIK